MGRFQLAVRFCPSTAQYLARTAHHPHLLDDHPSACQAHKGAFGRGEQIALSAVNALVTLTFASWNIESEEFEVVCPATLNAVCFRVPGRDDAGLHQIIAKLVEEGTALLGPVRLRGHAAIRACVTNFRTRASDIDHLVERLAALVHAKSR